MLGKDAASKISARTDSGGNRLSPSGSSLVLQTYVWQYYDMFPNFPAKDFLAV
jgi:hypothetical protein